MRKWKSGKLANAYLSRVWDMDLVNPRPKKSGWVKEDVIKYVCRSIHEHDNKDKPISEYISQSQDNGVEIQN